MSIVNIGLQAIALARRVMSQEMEAEAEKCNSMKALRAVAERNPAFREAALDSIVPVKIVLTNIAKRLELKGKKFSIFTAASTEELDDLWTTLLSIDQLFPNVRSDKFSAKELSEKIVKFIEHCCFQRHYLFDILKCGKADCDICLEHQGLHLMFSQLSTTSQTLFQDHKNTTRRFLMFLGQEQLKSTDLQATKDHQKTNLSHFPLAFNISKTSI